MTGQPAWVCADCGFIYGKRIIKDHCSTWHVEECDVCGVETMVTEPRDFGYLKPEWTKHKRTP